MSNIIRKIINNKKVLILILIAIVLYAFSFVSTEKEEKPQETKVVYTDEKKLEKVLSNVKGAGNVMVYITYENTGVKNIAYDYKNTENSNEISVKTMGKSSNEEPYVLSNTNPVIAGILVTATGAENDEMKAKLKKYVKAATNVSLNKIEVAQGER